MKATTIRKHSLNETSESGFTMIEALISLVVIMVASLGTVYTFTFATNYNSGASGRALAMAYVQQRAEQLRSLAFTDSSLNATSTTGTTETVSFEGQRLTVTTTIVNTTSTIKTITLSVAPSGGTGG